MRRWACSMSRMVLPTTPCTSSRTWVPGHHLSFLGISVHIFSNVLYSCSRKDSTPFIKNGTQGVITKTVVPEKSEKAGRGKALRQVVASFVANIGTINTGMAFGFSATALPQLKSPDSSIHITDSQASWVGKRNFLYSHKPRSHIIIVKLTHILTFTFIIINVISRPTIAIAEFPRKISQPSVTNFNRLRLVNWTVMTDMSVSIDWILSIHAVFQSSIIFWTWNSYFRKQP